MSNAPNERVVRKSENPARVVYRYAWGNNERRQELRGRLCVIETMGAKQTALVRFLDTGERVTTSVRALRAVEQDGEVLVHRG